MHAMCSLQYKGLAHVCYHQLFSNFDRGQLNMSDARETTYSKKLLKIKKINYTTPLILRHYAFNIFGPSHQNSGLKIVTLCWGILYKKTAGICSRLMAIRNYLCQYICN
jgi:hypothetical protein